jgi:hypothetical protein
LIRGPKYVIKLFIVDENALLNLMCLNAMPSIRRDRDSFYNEFVLGPEYVIKLFMIDKNALLNSMLLEAMPSIRRDRFYFEVIQFRL